MGLKTNTGNKIIFLSKTQSDDSKKYPLICNNDTGETFNEISDIELVGISYYKYKYQEFGKENEKLAVKMKFDDANGEDSYIISISYSHFLKGLLNKLVNIENFSNVFLNIKFGLSKSGYQTAYVSYDKTNLSGKYYSPNCGVDEMINTLVYYIQHRLGDQDYNKMLFIKDDAIYVPSKNEFCHDLVLADDYFNNQSSETTNQQPQTPQTQPTPPTPQTQPNQVNKTAQKQAQPEIFDVPPIPTNPPAIDNDDDDLPF